MLGTSNVFHLIWTKPQRVLKNFWNAMWHWHTADAFRRCCLLQMRFSWKSISWDINFQQKLFAVNTFFFVVPNWTHNLQVAFIMTFSFEIRVTYHKHPVNIHAWSRNICNNEKIVNIWQVTVLNLCQWDIFKCRENQKSHKLNSYI